MPHHVSIIDVFPPGTLITREQRFRCALGPAGIQQRKSEGDGVTPAGTFLLRRVYYRPDRLDPPQTGLPRQVLTPLDGWCDDPASDHYNQFVRLPFSGSHEELWRTDHVYDIILTVGYNDDPPVPGQGSAIFMHIAREHYAHTEGCITLVKQDFLEVLKACGTNTKLRIHPEAES